MGRAAALGFDVGTTSVKAGLVWLDGDAPMESVSVAYPDTRPRPGWVEQDASDWIASMRACWQALARRVPDVELRSVGICSQVNTHLVVDEALRPLRAAITWQDTRAAPEAAELDAAVAGRREQLWGGPFTVDASFSLSRLAWLTRHEPELVSRARWLLAPKDFCVAALTGEITTDAITPIGLVGADERYLPVVLELVDGAGRLLPPIAPFDSRAGNVRADNPLGLPEGLPVSVGTMDAWANVFGSGLVRPGQAMQVAGTSEILAVLSEHAIPTRGIITFAPVHGRILHAAPTQAGGAALEWAARGFGRTIEEVLWLADEGRPDARPIVFLPHLAGERAPHWDPSARGVFIGLDGSTELRHLALAVLEGVAFAAREALAGCEQAAGSTADEVRLTGGAARSGLWNSVKATVHGRPLVVLESLDSGVLGAALLGLVAAGLERGIEAAARRRVRLGHTVEPVVSGRARVEHLYGVYREAYAALVPVFSRLAGPGDAHG